MTINVMLLSLHRHLIVRRAAVFIPARLAVQLEFSRNKPETNQKQKRTSKYNLLGSASLINAGRPL